MVRCTALLALALGLGLGLGLGEHHPRTLNNGPNVLVIMTDDQGMLSLRSNTQIVVDHVHRPATRLYVGHAASEEPDWRRRCDLREALLHGGLVLPIASQLLYWSSCP